MAFMLQPKLIDRLVQQCSIVCCCNTQLCVWLSVLLLIERVVRSLASELSQLSTVFLKLEAMQNQLPPNTSVVYTSTAMLDGPLAAAVVFFVSTSHSSPICSPLQPQLPNSTSNPHHRSGYNPWMQLRAENGLQLLLQWTR